MSRLRGRDPWDLGQAMILAFLVLITGPPADGLQWAGGMAVLTPILWFALTWRWDSR